MAERPTLRDWLEEEPFTLAMSAGFFGFFAHCGTLSVLENEGLIPQRVVGSSAGGLVAGCWAAGVDAPVLEEELRQLRRQDFWDPFPGPGLLRGRKFRDHLSQILPVSRFEDTRADLAVSAFDVLKRKTVVLDGGDVISAVRATAALPMLFQPVWIGRRPYADGGILDRPGHEPLQTGERVFYHHLPSRSPWRRKSSPVLEIPQAHNMTTLAIRGLPRVNPFKLERGRQAMELARHATQRALNRPVSNGAVQLSVSRCES